MDHVSEAQMLMCVLLLKSFWHRSPPNESCGRPESTQKRVGPNKASALFKGWKQDVGPF